MNKQKFEIIVIIATIIIFSAEWFLYTYPLTAVLITCIKIIIVASYKDELYKYIKKQENENL